MYPELTKDNLIAIIGNTWYSTQILAENIKLYTLIYN